MTKNPTLERVKALRQIMNERQISAFKRIQCRPLESSWMDIRIQRIGRDCCRNRKAGRAMDRFPLFPPSRNST